MKKLCYSIYVLLILFALLFAGCKTDQARPDTPANKPSTDQTITPDEDDKSNTEDEDSDKDSNKNDEDSDSGEEDSDTDDPKDKDTTTTPDKNQNDNTTDDDEKDEETNEEPVVIKTDVYTVDAKTTSEKHSWNLASISLADYASKTVDITFSADLQVENSGSKATIAWQVNDADETYPTIASGDFPNGTSEWVTLTGSKKNINLNQYPVLYISANGITPENLKIKVKDIKVTVKISGSSKSSTLTEMTIEDGVTKKTETITDSNEEPPAPTNWLSSSVPSLYETYKDQFDYFGISTEYGNFGLKETGSNKYTATYTWDGSNWGTPTELYYEETQKALKKHANSTTMGNEFKPQFLLQWWEGDGSSQTMVNFTASNNKTIKVPASLKGENLIYATLNACKAANVKMRGHVLTWHSQTPDGFFAENYSPTYDGNLISNLVDKETMTARHEWYIKTVLDCVEKWEAANGYGKGNHLIWAWDVVNEACADDATTSNWLRGSSNKTKDKKPTDDDQGSRWYQLYGDSEFIVNAFRFANAYAPEDVQLCYNEYNEYMDNTNQKKTTAIEKLVADVKNGSAKIVNDKSVKPRIDAIGMQSHVGTSWPSVDEYESALKRFLALGLDVHVSELDFSAETQEAATASYEKYFTMLQKYGNKYSGSNKVKNVTIWGINNQDSWIYKDKVKYPLLFDNNKTTDSFWAVINAHN